MRSNEAGGSDSKRGANVSTRVDLHPSASRAANGMMTAMATEFDRWMADEVEELAESYSAAAGSESSPDVRAYLHELADQLARQAEMLGYPDVVEVAKRLAGRFDPQTPYAPEQATGIDLQIAELRALLKD